MTPQAQVAQSMARVRDGLHHWVEGLLDQAGMSMDVGGMLPTNDRPALVMLPYQVVLESQPGVPQVPLMPAGEGRRDTVPRGWQNLARDMTTVLVETFPKRPSKAPGLGPLSPRPAIAALPKPIADWYADNPDWRFTDEHGQLPQISWRQPFPLVVRFAAMVRGTVDDLTQLQALAVLASGIRQERYFRCEAPPTACSNRLSALVDAFVRSASPELKERMAASAEEIASERPLAVGVFPHHDLTDNDLALVMQALQLPMQPAIVFGARCSLGGGPVLLTGAVPHLGSVDKVER